MTLAELLVASAVLGLVLSGTFLALDQGYQAYAFGAARVESQQSARAALARMAHDVRVMAGGGSHGFAPIALAEPQRLMLQYDKNHDGIIAGTGETITWRLDGTILRRDAGGGGQPVINGVRGLLLTYFDADGAPTTTPEVVRSVEIRLTTGPDHAPRRKGWTIGATVATRVRVRNR
jgi:type II secretory pathway component PulJ